MKVDNPLSRQFLLLYPIEAARVLEQISAKHVAELFLKMSPQIGAPVIAAMLPEKAAACLSAMSITSAAKHITELPVSSAARIYSLLAPAKQDEMIGCLSDKIRNRIRRYLKFPPESAGALLEPEIDMLPESVTVSEANRRIERLGRSVSCEVYIINDTHQLVGMIELGRLIASNPHARLRDIMVRKTQSISAYSTAETLLLHPGWTTRRRLPVVGRDNSLMGVLDYNYLRQSVGETPTSSSRDPVQNLLSLAGLYWVSLAQLLDSVLNIAGPNKGARK